MTFVGMRKGRQGRLRQSVRSLANHSWLLGCQMSVKFDIGIFLSLSSSVEKLCVRGVYICVLYICVHVCLWGVCICVCACVCCVWYVYVCGVCVV